MPRLRLPKARIVDVPAAVWKRFVAFLADLMIVNVIILYPFKRYFESIMPTTNYKETINYIMANPSVVNTVSAIAIMVSILTVLYFSLSGYKTGTTIGKYFFRLKTKSLEKEARYWQYFVSSLTFVLFTPFVVLWIIDPIYMFLSEKRQRFMEKIAKLQTVEEVVVT